MARCVKVDDHEDYHHHCYGDYYVSVSVDPFEHVHSSLPFLKGSLVLEFFGSKITAVSGALPCDKLGQSNFQIRTKASELRTVSSSAGAFVGRRARRAARSRRHHRRCPSSSTRRRTSQSLSLPRRLHARCCSGLWRCSGLAYLYRCRRGQPALNINYPGVDRLQSFKNSLQPFI